MKRWQRWMNPVACFKAGVLAVLRAERTYIHALGEVLARREPPVSLTAPLWALRAEMASPQGLYPEWVFNFGFNYALRAGFRFFLIQIDRFNDLIFASNELFLWEDMPETVMEVVQKHEALLCILIEFFETEHWQDAKIDVVSDVSALRAMACEGGFSPQRVSAWVRQLVDMRDCLLQLVMALPGATRSANAC